LTQGPLTLLEALEAADKCKENCEISFAARPGRLAKHGLGCCANAAAGADVWFEGFWRGGGKEVGWRRVRENDGKSMETKSAMRSVSATLRVIHVLRL